MKARAERRPEYLRFIRELPCALCNKPGPNEPHHESTARYPKGMGIKPDDRSVIPLCHKCHRLRHDKGRSVLGGIDIDYWQDRLWDAFIALRG